MNENNGDDGKPAQPPAGVLAAEALKNDETKSKAETEVLATKPPSTLPVDPNYIEPTSLAKYQEMALKLCREATENESAVSLQRKALIDFLLVRVGTLESAVMPFAHLGVMMDNARMCLIADKRASEPAGGTWLSNVQGIRLQPNEGYFFNACDALGRARTQEYVVDLFERIQRAAEGQREKAAHVEDGGRADH